MSWGGYPEEDPELLRERQEQEERAYFERRQEDDQVQQHWVHFFSLDGWIDRLYDAFIREHGDH